MADEIVTWLRELANSDATECEECVYTEAADEIERLRAEVTRHKSNSDRYQEIATAARAALERYRGQVDQYGVHSAAEALGQSQCSGSADRNAETGEASPRHICTESGGGHHYSECSACSDGVPLPGDEKPAPAAPYGYDEFFAEVKRTGLTAEKLRDVMRERLSPSPPPAPASEGQDEPPPAWVVALIRNTFQDAQAGKVFGTENALSDESVETMRAFLERWDRPAVQPPAARLPCLCPPGVCDRVRFNVGWPGRKCQRATDTTRADT